MRRRSRSRRLRSKATHGRASRFSQFLAVERTSGVIGSGRGTSRTFSTGRLEWTSMSARRWRSTRFPGESERDFRIRLSESARVARDREVEKARAKLERGLNSLVAQLERAEVRVERERSEASQKKWDSVLSIGSSIAGALLGRKTLSAANVSRVGSAARSMKRASLESSDVGRAEEGLTSLQERKAALEAEIEAELQAIRVRFDVANLEVESIEIRPETSRHQGSARGSGLGPWGVGDVS